MSKMRQELDEKLLEAYEDLSRVFWQAKEELKEYNQELPQFNRMSALETILTSERRLIEEISLPGRLILEHFSSFVGKIDHSLGYKIGKFQTGRGLLKGFEIDEWSNIILDLGSVKITWRDADYQYFFYPDKVIMRPLDINKPEIHFYLTFAFKYSHILDMFSDVKNHPQVEYWHDDLNEE